MGCVAPVLYREPRPQLVGRLSGPLWFLMLPSHQRKRAVCSETPQCPACCSQRQRANERDWLVGSTCVTVPGQLTRWWWGVNSFSENFWKNRGVSPCASWLESFSAHSRSPGSMSFQCLLLMVATENAGWVGPSMHRKLRLLEIVHFLVEAGRNIFPMGERGRWPWFESFNSKCKFQLFDNHWRERILLKVLYSRLFFGRK